MSAFSWEEKKKKRKKVLQLDKEIIPRERQCNYYIYMLNCLCKIYMYTYAFYVGQNEFDSSSSRKVRQLDSTAHRQIFWQCCNRKLRGSQVTPKWYFFFLVFLSSFFIILFFQCAFQSLRLFFPFSNTHPLSPLPKSIQEMTLSDLCTWWSNPVIKQQRLIFLCIEIINYSQFNTCCTSQCTDF